MAFLMFIFRTAYGNETIRIKELLEGALIKIGNLICPCDESGLGAGGGPAKDCSHTLPPSDRRPPTLSPTSHTHYIFGLETLFGETQN